MLFLILLFRVAFFVRSPSALRSIRTGAGNICWPPWLAEFTARAELASNGALAEERWRRMALATSTTAPNVFVEIRKIVICYVMPPGFTENDFSSASKTKRTATHTRSHVLWLREERRR